MAPTRRGSQQGPVARFDRSPIAEWPGLHAITLPTPWEADSVQVYLIDMNLFQRMNKIYMEFFPEPRPARTTVGVAALVGESKIEITVTAWKAPKAK